MTLQKYRAIAVLYAVALTAASVQRGRPSGLHASGFHAPLHLICFGVLVLVTQAGFVGNRHLLWIIPASVMLGLTIEFLQHFLSQEAMEWNDVASDSMGAGVAGLVCMLRRRTAA